MQNIPVNERLIMALDVDDVKRAKEIVDELGDVVQFYKVGLGLLMGGEYFNLVCYLKEKNKRVFVDLKFFDIPNTVTSAISKLNDFNVDFTTVHGNDEMLKAAVNVSTGVKIFAVTALTSLDSNDLQDLGFTCDIKDLVLSRARRALEIGCYGVVSSGLEVKEIRDGVSDGLTIICPGIRPVENIEDDQKRTMSVEEAFGSGADYIVIGRPILQASNILEAAQSIQNEIVEFFAK